MNVLFGFMTELCLVNKKMFLDIFEEEENFDRVLQYSRDFALRC